MDPLAAPPEAGVFWLPREDTSTIILGEAPASVSTDFERQPAMAPARTITAADGPYALHDLGTGQYVRLVQPADTPADTALAALIPLSLDGFDRLEAVGRLLAVLHGRTGPPETRLTHQRRARLRRMLQSFDGYRNGATQQEIAQVVFHMAPLDRDAWQASSTRHAIKSLLRDARAMIAGGYRTLLRHRRQA